MIKCLIINYQRITLPMKLAAFVHNHGIEPVIIDNNSDYPPLLEFYDTRCPYKVVRMDDNYGHLVVWKKNLLKHLGITGRYIVTDPDLDLSLIPGDWLSVMEAGLRKYPQFDKCGFSLEINDLKNQPTIDWENKFWQYPIDDRYFIAQIDTTFALYNKPEFCLDALRTNRPYTAKHLPWYWDQVRDLPPDEQHYYNTQKREYADHSNVKGRNYE
jgi:hypothetical protein